MSKPFDWTPLVPYAIAELRQMNSAVIDRIFLEKLLKVHRRTAIRLLHQFGAEQLGKTLLISRERLLLELEAYLPSDATGIPIRTSGQIRRLHREAESFRFAGAHHPERRTAEGLPAAIQISPGRLTVEAASLRELCAQLWVLLETCKEDWEGMEGKLAAEA